MEVNGRWTAELLEPRKRSWQTGVAPERHLSPSGAEAIKSRWWLMNFDRSQRDFHLRLAAWTDMDWKALGLYHKVFQAALCIRSCRLAFNFVMILYGLLSSGFRKFFRVSFYTIYWLLRFHDNSFNLSFINYFEISFERYFLRGLLKCNNVLKR